MPYVEREDVRLFYLDEGAGMPVLLLHGHTLDRRVWDLVVPGLHAAGLRTLRPDLRGHGRSSTPDQGYHWSHHAEDTAAVLADAGVTATAVVGFSLGGGVALELAVTRPQLVSALVLVAPVMPERPFEPAFVDNLRQVARAARADGISAAMLGPWMESPLLAASLSTPGVRERVMEMVGEFPGADYLATSRDSAAREWTVPDRLGEVGVPTVVAVGEREMDGFRAFADEAVAGIAGARAVVVPGAGHLLPLETPDVVADLVVEHLGREA